MLFKITLKRGGEPQLATATIEDAISLLENLERAESITFEVSEMSACIRCGEDMTEETTSVNNEQLCDYCYHVSEESNDE